MKGVNGGRRPWLLLPLAALVAGAALAGSLVLLQDDDGAAADTPAGVEVDLRAPSRQPQPPEAAQAPTEAGATAFALFWFDLLNWSLANADPGPLGSWTGAGCGQCNGWLIAMQQWRGSGARLEGGLTVPLDLAIGPLSTTEPTPFQATFLTTPAAVASAGGEVQEYPGGRTRGGLAVLWANGRWQMTDVVLDTAAAGQQTPVPSAPGP